MSDKPASLPASRFKTIDERGSSSSTNSIQGYFFHRYALIAHLDEALEYLKRHLDFRAFGEIDKAVACMAMLKKYDAYANETSNLLLESANTIECLQKGVGVTSSHDLIADLREVAMGRMK